jgi:uncharacterized protein
MSYLVIGLVAGVLSGVFGIGGGVIIVPALILISHMKPHTATGTSLGALLLPVGLLGAWQYWQKGDVNVAAALLLGLGVFVGALFGARIGLGLAPRALERTFAVMLVVVAARLWWKS